VHLSFLQPSGWCVSYSYAAALANDSHTTARYVLFRFSLVVVLFVLRRYVDANENLVTRLAASRTGRKSATHLSLQQPPKIEGDLPVLTRGPQARRSTDPCAVALVINISDMIRRACWSQGIPGFYRLATSGGKRPRLPGETRPRRANLDTPTIQIVGQDVAY
jgi:hypothetical protein